MLNMTSLRGDGARAPNATTIGALAFTLILASLTALGATVIAPEPAAAKTPGSTYCFYGKCHRVKTLGETRRLIGKRVTLTASHYNECGRDRYNPCGLTSSGERFHAKRADNAASPIYPDGTILLVWSKTTRQAVVLRVNNAGPYWGNRKLDVSIGAARKLGFARRGVARLETVILKAPTRNEARYKRHRTYSRVLGPIGQYDSLEGAKRAAVAVMALEAIAGNGGTFASAGVAAAAKNETTHHKVRRNKVASRAKALKRAMLAPETRWPEFAQAVGAPSIPSTKPESARLVVVRKLSAPVLSVSATSKTSKRNIVVASRVNMKTARSANTIKRHRAYRSNATAGPMETAQTWLRPARPAVELVRAVEVGAPQGPAWLGRDRLQPLLKISNSRRGWQLSANPQRKRLTPTSIRNRRKPPRQDRHNG